MREQAKPADAEHTVKAASPHSLGNGVLCTHQGADVPATVHCTAPAEKKCNVAKQEPSQPPRELQRPEVCCFLAAR